MLARLRASSGEKRGFSLIELMVVISIIAILAVLAAPAASAAMLDRRVYNDAGSIMQLFRSARTRAIARGAAELISMDNSSGLATILLYEAVQQNLQGAGKTTPSPSCKTPTVWASPTLAANTLAQLVDGVNLNGPGETTGHFQTTFKQYPTPTGGTQIFPLGYICYTPLGRSFLNTDAVATPTFDGKVSTTTVLELEVQRNDTGGAVVGTVRSVLVPPNGMARLFSHL